MNRKGAEAQRINTLSKEVIGAAIEVHRGLGPGLLVSAYEQCLCYELKQRGIEFNTQVEIPVIYKGVYLNCGYRADVVVEGILLIELKAVDRMLPVHEAQLLTYLKLTNNRLGLLINFNVPVLKQGIKRIAFNL